MSWTRWIVAMVAAVVLLPLSTGCSDEPVGDQSQAGTLILRLTTPHADDGAVLFVVNGPPVDSATTANASLRLFTRQAGSSTVVGAVVGTLSSGAVVTLHVPDVSAVGEYAAQVVEVADRQDALRALLAGYALVVTR